MQLAIPDDAKNVANLSYCNNQQIVYRVNYCRRSLLKAVCRFCSWAFLSPRFWSLIRRRNGAPPNVYEIFSHRWTVNLTHIFLSSFSHFYRRDQKVRNLASIFDPSHFSAMMVWKRSNIPKYTSSWAIAERSLCRVGQFRPKVEDEILQAI